MPTIKPKIIVISGAPGSGKSTLAKKLTEYIQFIYIDADAVLQNIWLNNTENKDYDRESVGVPMLFDLVAQLGKVNSLNIILDTIPSNEMDQKKLADAFEVKHIHAKQVIQMSASMSVNLMKMAKNQTGLAHT